MAELLGYYNPDSITGSTPIFWHSGSGAWQKLGKTFSTPVDISWDIEYIKVKVLRTGTIGNALFKITSTTAFNKPQSDILGSKLVDVSDVTTDGAGEWLQVDFGPSVEIPANTGFGFTIEPDAAWSVSGGNSLKWGTNTAAQGGEISPAYNWVSSGTSPTWDQWQILSSGKKLLIEIWGTKKTIPSINSTWLSSNGNFIVVAADNGMFLSTDFGDNWTRKTPDDVADTDWEKGICSSDGTYIIVVSDADAIYRSANSGSSWAEITPAGGDTFSVNKMATSDDGQFMVIVGQNSTDDTESCYISTDYGATWTAKKPVAASIEYTECDISNDGTVITVSTTSNFYISFDSGTTWMEQGMASTAEVWEGLSISGDGTTGLVANTNDNDEFFIGINTELFSRATWAESTITSAGRALLDDATVADQNTTLGFGTGDSPTLTGLTLSGLTATRIPFAGAGGLLSDDSDLTFSGSTLSATNVTASGTVRADSLISKDLLIDRSDVQRQFKFELDSTGNALAISHIDPDRDDTALRLYPRITSGAVAFILESNAVVTSRTNNVRLAFRQSTSEASITAEHSGTGFEGDSTPFILGVDAFHNLTLNDDGTVTFGGNFIIPDDAFIGSESAINAINIDEDGAVVFIDDITVNDTLTVDNNTHLGADTSNRTSINNVYRLPTNFGTSGHLVTAAGGDGEMTYTDPTPAAGPFGHWDVTAGVLSPIGSHDVELPHDLDMAGTLTNVVPAAATQSLMIDGASNPYTGAFGAGVTFNEITRTAASVDQSYPSAGIGLLNRFNVNNTHTGSTFGFGGTNKAWYGMFGGITLGETLDFTSGAATFGTTYIGVNMSAQYNSSFTSNIPQAHHYFVLGARLKSVNAGIFDAVSGSIEVDFIGAELISEATVTSTSANTTFNYIAGKSTAIGSLDGAVSASIAHIFSATGSDTNVAIQVAAGTTELLDTNIGDGTNEMKVSAAGILSFAGTGGLLYGNMDQDGGVFTVFLENVDQLYELDAATTNISAGPLNDVTFPGNHYLEVKTAGVYKIDWSLICQISGLTGGSEHVEFEVLKNGNATGKGESHVTHKNTTRDFPLASTTLLDLAVDDEISIGATARDSSGKTITIDHLEMSIFMVGGT